MPEFKSTQLKHEWERVLAIENLTPNDITIEDLADDGGGEVYALDIKDSAFFYNNFDDATKDRLLIISTLFGDPA